MPTCRQNLISTLELLQDNRDTLRNFIQEDNAPWVTLRNGNRLQIGNYDPDTKSMILNVRASLRITPKRKAILIGAYRLTKAAALELTPLESHRRLVRTNGRSTWHHIKALHLKN